MGEVATGVHRLGDRLVNWWVIVDAVALDDGETLDVPGRPRFIEAPGHGEPWVDGAQEAATRARATSSMAAA